MEQSARLRLRVVVTLLWLTIVSSSAFGQPRVRVTTDQATIWTLGVPTVAAVVPAGTELEVVAQRDTWYEVVLPSPTPGGGRTGLIAAGQVEGVAVATPIPPPPAPVEPAPPEETPPVSEPPAKQRQTPPAPRSSSAVSEFVQPRFRVFGQLGFGRFLADQSFGAIFDHAGGLWLGGGARFGVGRRAFVQASVDRFQRTGERVFVFDDEVFPLGLADRLTLLPIVVTAGYTFPRRTLMPYVGGGIGRYFLVEASDFADDVEEQFTSYHVVGGFEWRNSGVLGAAVEMEYTHVPGAFDGGVAALFEEENLGGLQLRFRVLIGR